MGRNDYKIGVLGSGSMATAIVKILLNNTFPINWWVREPEIIDSIQRTGHNSNYLSSVFFDTKKIKLYSDIKKVIAKSDYIVIVIPAAFIDSSFSELDSSHFKNKFIVSAVKGIIPEQIKIVADYLIDNFEIPIENISIITGPSHAEEIASEKLTYLTSASQNIELSSTLAKIFSCDYVKTNISDDIYGTEYAAVLKNIYALGCGIFKGLGYGDNFLAAFISNCTKEMKRFITAVHPIYRTFYDSAYLGDLLVTAYSQFSRNRTFGNMIGQGYSVSTAKLEMKMIAEGYYATQSIFTINKTLNVDIPIVDAIYNILYLGKPQAQEMEKICDIIV